MSDISPGARDDPVLVFPALLTAWGSDTRNNVHSSSAMRIPKFSLTKNATFTAFARTPQNGQRTIFSVESPYCFKSFLYVGTAKGSREVEVGSIVSDTEGSGPTVLVDIDQWTHVALVWGIDQHVLLLYVNGCMVKQLFMSSPEIQSFFKAVEDLHLVIGRSKADGKTTCGWDGQITDVRVWQRELTPHEIQDIAKQQPAPLNPALTKVWTDRQC